MVELWRGAGQAGQGQGATLTAQMGGLKLPFRVVWPTASAPIRIEDVVLDRLDAHRQVLRFTLVDASGTSLSLSHLEVVRLFVQLEPPAVALDVIHALRRGC